MKSFFSKLMTKVSGALTEVNSKYWSLTKLAMLMFMYPTITGVYIYDVVHYARMDVINSMVFICAIVTPRISSQILAARFGVKTDDKPVEPSPEPTPDPLPEEDPPASKRNEK
jgi:hypothetical protein